MYYQCHDLRIRLSGHESSDGNTLHQSMDYVLNGYPWCIERFAVYRLGVGRLMSIHLWMLWFSGHCTTAVHTAERWIIRMICTMTAIPTSRTCAYKFSNPPPPPQNINTDARRGKITQETWRWVTAWRERREDEESFSSRKKGNK